MGDEDLKWYHLALCKGMNELRSDEEPHEHKDYFAEEYESDPVMAMVMDSICLSCPVRNFCLREGVDNGEYGLWGGVFLINGIADEAKNAHKSEEVWQQIREGIG